MQVTVARAVGIRQFSWSSALFFWPLKAVWSGINRIYQPMGVPGLVGQFRLTRHQFHQHCSVGVKNKQDIEVKACSHWCTSMLPPVSFPSWDSSRLEGESHVCIACRSTAGCLKGGGGRAGEGMLGSGEVEKEDFLRVEMHEISPLSNLSVGSYC